MAATSYDSLFPYIMVDTPDAPAPVVTAMINLAARELCLRSQCWSEWKDVPLVDGTSEYTIASPSSSSVVRAIQGVRIGDRKMLIPETEDSALANKRYLFSTVGEPEVFFMTSDMKMKVLPVPSASEAGKIMSVKVSYMPDMTATEIPSTFIERFSECLIAGAKFYLMSMNGKAWSNPKFAAAYKQQFDILIDKARIEVEMSYSPANLRVSYRKFGAL